MCHVLAEHIPSWCWLRNHAGMSTMTRVRLAAGAAAPGPARRGRGGGVRDQQLRVQVFLSLPACITSDGMNSPF